MTEYIANDFASLKRRMEEIQTERSRAISSTPIEPAVENFNVLTDWAKKYERGMSQNWAPSLAEGHRPISWGFAGVPTSWGLSQK